MTPTKPRTLTEQLQEHLEKTKQWAKEVKEAARVKRTLDLQREPPKPWRKSKDAR